MLLVYLELINNKSSQQFGYRVHDNWALNFKEFLENSGDSLCATTADTTEVSLSEFTQSVAGVSTIGVAQSGASPAHGHHQIVDGGLRDVFQFLLESHTELADVLWDCITIDNLRSPSEAVSQ